MKALFKNIRDAPAATASGAISAGIAVIISSDLQVPIGVTVTLGVVATVLAIFSGPNKS